MGQADEHLPIDLRNKASSGVGGGARENRDAAIAHDAAIAAAGATPQKAEAGAGADGDVSEVEPVTLTECPSCNRKLDDGWNFCAKCGHNLISDPRKILNIEFSEEDLDEYLFRGYLTKEVKVAGRSLMLRSSIAQDHEKISTYLMGEWNDREVTQDFWENLRNMAAVSRAIISFDGKDIGEEMPARVEWVMARGSALVDMMLNRVVLFNRAVTAWLEDKNSFLAS